MSDTKKFQVVGGRVVPVGQDPHVVSHFTCTMCKLRSAQVEDLKLQIRDRDKRIDSLKAELTRTQQRQSTTRTTYSGIDHERVVIREEIRKFARAVTIYMRYSRIVLWFLKQLKDHPPGGFCMMCDQPEGSPHVECSLAALFDEPGNVVLAHKDTKINDRDLPIPEELRLEEVELLIEKPWALWEDVKKSCNDRACGLSPLKGKLFCLKHMPRGY